MQTLERFLIRPRLRDQVSIRPSAAGTALEYRLQSCDLDHSEEAAADVHRVLSHLRDGATLDELIMTSPAIADEIPRMVSDLDRLGLLTESETTQPLCVTGVEFHRELMVFAESWTASHCRSRFYLALKEGEATRQQIIRYAIEYYHIVRASVSLIAPALGHTMSDTERRILTDFVRSEMGHDLLMAESLAAVGITREQLHAFLPLPATFALCSTLGVLAVQDFLSFQCALFLFEAPSDEFTAALVERCQVMGLPERFWKPIVRHAVINDEGDHGNITAALLRERPVVGIEERLVMKKHLAVVIEFLAQLEDQLLSDEQSCGSAFRWQGEEAAL